MAENESRKQGRQPGDIPRSVRQRTGSSCSSSEDSDTTLGDGPGRARIWFPIAGYLEHTLGGGAGTTSPSACVTLPTNDTSATCPTCPTTRYVTPLSDRDDLPDDRCGLFYGLLDRDVMLSALRLPCLPSVSLARQLRLLGAARDEAFRREVPAPRDQGPRAHGALGRRVAFRALFSPTGASSSAPFLMPDASMAFG